MRPRTRGFTLIELLVAVALLAILAILSWRGLDSVLSTRSRLTERSDELRAMTVGFAQLDDDLRRSWPVRVLQLPYTTLGFSRLSPEAPLTMEMLREGGGALDVTRIERVSYRLRDGVLERGFGPMFDAAAEAGAGMAMSQLPLVWQPLLGGIAAVQFRGFIRNRGWIDGETLALAAQQAQSADQTARQAAARAGSLGADTGTNSAEDVARRAADSAAQAAGTSATALQLRAIEFTLMRVNGERYVRVFPIED